MGLQKYRADTAGRPYDNGGIPWYSTWIGGPSLALIRNCPTPFGPRTVYIQGEPDTFFSQPAKCRYLGKTIKGWVECDESGYMFHCQDKP